ncbi:MAG: phosphatidylglycerophosphatase A [Acidobacteriia bacterium]|nr:phosphatidylglycerophosphatase A [Terriglobia bacterium]
MPGAGAEKIVKGKKPRVALALATVLGIGYAPKAPGTCGSVVGVALAPLLNPLTLLALVAIGMGTDFAMAWGIDMPMFMGRPAPVLGSWILQLPTFFLLILIAWLGVWSAKKTALYANIEDPQYVVIDEVSGQLLTLFLPLIPVAFPTHIMGNLEAGSKLAVYFTSSMLLLNWKYLLLGFILFRVFDIWKPFPVRQLEKLPSGWGIMADDWMAGIYAAVVLRVVIHLGLI